jgi:hypothetical protein
LLAEIQNPSAYRSQNPEATDWKFCIYDEMHKDYGYTPAWVKLLVEKLKDQAEFESLYDSAHMNLAADQTT